MPPRPRSSGIPAATSRHDNSSIHSCVAGAPMSHSTIASIVSRARLIWLPLSLTDPRIPGARDRRPHGRIRVALDRGRHKHQRQIAEIVLKAYLGPQTGRRVLAGQIRPGSGESIAALLGSPALLHANVRSIAGG